MELSLYSVRDNKVSAYGKPFPEANNIQATRGLQIAVNTKEIQLSIFPEDFDLYKVGVFDDQTGEITTQKPEFIISAVSLVKKEEKNG
jgi:hypothetical protein